MELRAAIAVWLSADQEPPSRGWLVSHSQARRSEQLKAEVRAPGQAEAPLSRAVSLGEASWEAWVPEPWVSPFVAVKGRPRRYLPVSGDTSGTDLQGRWPVVPSEQPDAGAPQVDAV